jgi:site-specific DNA-methyltransferase (adenine-specific)
MAGITYFVALPFDVADGSIVVGECFEASQDGALVVLLAHSRTDTRWFHDWVYGKAAELRFVRGRPKFGDGKQSAPFPSLISVFNPRTKH